eukprot:jgi/Mesvir1/29415/Mv23001-RA.1
MNVTFPHEIAMPSLGKSCSVSLRWQARADGFPSIPCDINRQIRQRGPAKPCSRRKTVAPATACVRVSSVPATRDDDVEIYVCLTPLQATHPVGVTAMRLLAWVAPIYLEHTVTVVQANNKWTCYDFLPESAESPATAFDLLRGSHTKGITRRRELNQRPKRRCWKIGTAVLAHPLTNGEHDPSKNGQDAGSLAQGKNAFIHGAQAVNAAFGREGGAGTPPAVGTLAERVERTCLRYNEGYDLALRLFRNDCRDHTRGLVKLLTGEDDVMRRIQELSKAEKGNT